MTPAPVARLRTPGEVAAAVPWLVGFHPSESLVVVVLHEPRGRVGLTMRFDLPDDSSEAALVADVVARVRHESAARALVVVYTDAPDVTDAAEAPNAARAREALGAGDALDAPKAPDAPDALDALDRLHATDAPGGLVRERLVQRLTDGLRAHDMDVREALLVRAGRWWSYACDGPCCPPDGTPLDAAASSSAVALVASESVLAGRGVLSSRDDLARGLAVDGDARELRRACVEAQRSVDRDRARPGGAAELRAQWRRALDALADPTARLDDAVAARLAASLADRQLRDEIAVEALVRPDALLLLLRGLARRTPAPFDAPVCALLAWVAYGRGDGGLANVALERALASDPEHSLAVLLADALHRQVPPSLLREVLLATRAELGRRPA